MARREISRRDLFGLGVARARRHAAAARPAVLRSPPSPMLDEMRRRWAATLTPEGDALWAPVAEALLAQAGDLTGAYVLLDRVGAPEGTSGVGRVPGDAHALPFADGTFDAAVSAFGPQSAPAGDDRLREVLRCVQPQGVVALALWGPGLLPELLRAAAAVDPLPEGVPGAWEWADEALVREELPDARIAPGELRLEAGSVSEALGRLIPAVPALAAAVDRAAAPARTRFTAVAEGFAVPGPGGVALPVPYLLVSARA